MNETTTAPETTALPTPKGGASARIAARTAALVAKDAPDPVPDAESASAADGARPPPTAAAGADSASGAPSEETAAGRSPAAPDGATAPEAPTTEEEQRRALYAEKLAAIRERRREQRDIADAARLREEAARAKAEAEAEKKRAAEVRAELDAGRKDFRKFFAANGMNAREAYDEMTRQAIEDGKPEALIRSLQEEWKKEADELRSEVKTLREERDAARAEREQQALSEGIRSDFAEAVKDKADYDDLRDAYPDEQLVDKATALINDPESFHRYAKRYNVRLTAPGGRYNMTDILNVLAAANAEYEAGKSQRRAARTAAAPPSQAAPKAASPTVNGTAERRNAGAVIGNDLAQERASDGKFLPRGSTAGSRIRERVRRLSGG